MRMQKWWGVTATVLALLLSGPAWDADAQDEYDAKLVKAAQAEGRLVIYSAMRRTLGVQLIAAFEKKFGLKVDFTRKTTGAIVQMIEAERLAGASRFDVTGSADESVIRRWMKQGLLEPYNPASARFFPKDVAKPVGYVNYTWLSLYVLAYNKKKVAPGDVPKNWKDALHPRWKGRLAMAHPKTAAGSRLLLDAAYERYGWDYFRALAKNRPLLVRSIAALPRLLSSGEADLVLAGSESDHLLRISKGEPFGVVYPTDFIPTAHFSVAMRSKAPHPNAAKLWMEFELSPEAQKIYADSGRIPMRPGISTPYDRPPLKELKIELADPDRLSKRRKKLVSEFEKIMKKAR